MNIYISAPITNIPFDECEKTFDQAVKEITERGHFAVSPWHISKTLPRTFSHSDYLAVDLEALKRCDAVYFLAGWEYSKGCKIERGWCYVLDIPFFDDIEEVPT